MITLIFIFSAVISYAVGYRLVKKGSPFRKTRGQEYLRKRKRKAIGQILYAVAAFFAVLAVINLTYSNKPPEIPPPNDFANNPPLGPIPAPPSPPEVVRPKPPPPPPVDHELEAAKQKRRDAEMEKANAALKKNPSNVIAHADRGNIFAEEHQWAQAEKEFRSALAIDARNVGVKFDLAELEFAQKKYDEARPLFAALEQDRNLGDLAAYEVYLCDLFGGHEDIALKQLEAFNKAGLNASYYFANLAWALYHQNTAQAHDWMISAEKIYPRRKFDLYANNLVILGYLNPPAVPL